MTEVNRQCLTKGCGGEAEWVPHIKVKPPNGMEGGDLVFSLSFLLCYDCKSRASIEDYITHKDWELITKIFSFGPIDDPTKMMIPEREDAELVFHTVEEVIAYVEMGNETYQ